jgi:hypothetical protein
MSNAIRSRASSVDAYGFFVWAEMEVAMELEREEFINQRQAYKRFGISPMTLRSRMRAGQLPTYENPLDSRVRLFRVGDIEELSRPRPASDKTIAASAA